MTSQNVPAGYFYFQSIPTRWKDNDQYGHVNNVEYYSFFDTVINKWLIESAKLNIHDGGVIAVCAESSCHFMRPVSFPEVIQAGMRIAQLGTTSVRYEIGLFDSEFKEALAEGWFVHVFVSRRSRKPEPIPEEMRQAMKAILVPEG
jgi:acyl-CoA thioester hydrolase